MSRTQARASTSGRGAARDGARGGNRIGRGAAPQITLAGTSRPAAAACACGGGCPRCVAQPVPSPGLLLQRQEEPETPTAPATSTMACTRTASFPEGLGRLDVTFPFATSGPLTDGDRRRLDRYEALWHDARQDSRRAAFRVDGFAEETETQPNRLACERAQIVGEDLQRRGVPAADIALFSHGTTERFSPDANRRTAVFLDVPEASGIPEAEDRQATVYADGLAATGCRVAGTPAYKRNHAGHLVLDVAGEGCIADANNVNPTLVRFGGPLRGMPIPNHVCGVSQSIPIGDNSVDFLNAEGSPLDLRSYREFVRVIRPNGTICIYSDLEEAVEAGMRWELDTRGAPYSLVRSGPRLKVRMGLDSNNQLNCPPRCRGQGVPP